MSGSTLSSVRRCLEVLEAFTAEEPELSLAQVSRRLGCHKSSVFRILSTLAARGYVEKNALNHTYRLGWKLLDLAGRLAGGYKLPDIAAPFMEALAQSTGEIVHLSILDGEEIVYLEKKGRSQPLTVSAMVGGRNPAHASAMGKVLLSGLPKAERAALLGRGPLARLTANTITDPQLLSRELEAVRRRGYALDDEESFQGIRCLAAPLRDRDGRVVAAISVTAPRQRLGSRRAAEIRRQVLEAARLISERIPPSVSPGD